jgi:hypothetical protein
MAVGICGRLGGVAELCGCQGSCSWCCCCCNPACCCDVAVADHRPCSTSARPPLQTCYNCSTTSTPLWRKERETGRMYCNACGIFKKTHGIERPLGALS